MVSRADIIIISFFITALGYITARAWRDTFQMIIDRYISRGDGIIANIIYSLIITAISVGFILLVSRNYRVKPSSTSGIISLGNGTTLYGTTLCETQCESKRKICEEECPCQDRNSFLCVNCQNNCSNDQQECEKQC